MSRLSQGTRILNYLKDTDSWITPMDAIREFGCTKLATRISELIDSGYPIEKQLVSDKNRYGQTVHYMRYRLVRACQTD